MKDRFEFAHAWCSPSGKRIDVTVRFRSDKLSSGPEQLFGPDEAQQADTVEFKIRVLNTIDMKPGTETQEVDPVTERRAHWQLVALITELVAAVQERPRP